MSTVSENKTDLDAALLAAQAEFPAIPKDATNTYFNTQYSTLDAIISATRPALVKHSLLLNHRVEDTETGIRVTAILRHTPSKEERTNSLSCETPRSNPQSLGSIITYLRRYTASPLLGVTPDQDDDGNAAGNKSNGKSEPAQQKRTTRRQSNGKSEPATPETKKSAPPAEKPAPAANFMPPPEWPDTKVDELMKWIDGLASAASFQLANRLLFGEETPFVSMGEREPLNKHLYSRYHEKLAPKSDQIKASAESITREIDETWQKTQLDKEALRF